MMDPDEEDVVAPTKSIGRPERCAICDATVYANGEGRPDARRGPEGVMRCFDHLGVPVPPGWLGPPSR